MSVAVELRDLTVAYERHPAVHHVGGTFAPGSLTALVGPNGAGKSSLLRCVAGLIAPAEGSVRLTPPGAMAFLPQLAEIDRDFPISVADLVGMGHWRRVGAFGRIGADMRAATEDALAAVGLHGFGRRAIGTLSAGQFQRALFARLILQDAPLILLDEPFAGIDERTIADLLAIIARWHAEGRTLVAVLHDIEQVRRHFPRTLLLARRVVAWGETAEVLTPPLLREARAMAETWVEDAAICAAPALS